jgi:hypothetical protein
VQEQRNFLCSTRLSAQAFARAVRAHWGVENRLHWVLGVIVHDDLAWLRSGFCPENMAVVKHMAMNLLRSPRNSHQPIGGINLKQFPWLYLRPRGPGRSGELAGDKRAKC